MKLKLTQTLILFFSFSFLSATAQLKQFYKDVDEDNDVRKISFYTKSEGYVAFKKFIGYTTDGGHTFTKKNITASNVNFNGNNVNLTFGFAISGVKAVDKNVLIVYGDYGLVPTILYSTDQGNTFKVVYHAQLAAGYFSYFSDLTFPDNGTTGYVIDELNLFKTTDKGLTWSVLPKNFPGRLQHLVALSTTNMFVTTDNGIMKSADAGITWSKIVLPIVDPQVQIKSIFFLSPEKGWINCLSNGVGYVYYTANGGASFAVKNNTAVSSYVFNEMKFFDDNLGFAIGENYTTYKTSDAGKIWEAIPRDNSFNFLGYSHYTMSFWDSDLFWVGGGHGFLESSNNGGGSVIPSPYFTVDKSNLGPTNSVTLINQSKPGYTYQWFKNDTLISTSYNASYLRNISHLTDTIKLVAINGSVQGSAEKIVTLLPPLEISSFSPKRAGVGMEVVITGKNFNNIESLTFGGVEPTILSGTSTRIVVQINTGSSGKLVIKANEETTSADGFEFVPPPVGSLPLIVDITPNKGTADEYVSIIGYNLNNSTSLTVGYANATFQTSSNNLIMAYVGEGTDGPVSITTPYGTSSYGNFTFIKPAKITTFSPEKAVTGTKITIRGENFNPDVGKNQVLFGTISAKVVAASTNQIEVLVPKSAPYQQLSVTADGRTAYSGKPFNLLFPNGLGIKTESFEKSIDIPIAGTGIRTLQGDIDGDQKVDLVISYFLDGRRFCRIYRNLSTARQISFAEAYEIDFVEIVALADFDGDGKVDLLEKETMIFKNASTPGKIAFFHKANVPNSSTTALATDVDGDGKTDLLHASGVMKSSSTSNAILFRSNYLGTGPVLCSADIDGDGKPDLISSQPGTALIILNKSRPGRLLFATPVAVRIIDGDPIKAADIDGDGKTDLISIDGIAQTMTILHNTSKVDQVSFDAPLVYPALPLTQSLEIADLDGDGRPDVIANSAEQLYLYQNLSEPNEIKFAKLVPIYHGESIGTFSVADLDGDNKMEIIIPDASTGLVTIFKNNVKPDPVLQDFNPKTAAEGEKVTIRGVNLAKTTAVKFGNVNAMFSIKSDTEIIATVGSGASGDVTVSTAVGTNFLSGFYYGRVPKVSGIAQISLAAGAILTINGSNFSKDNAANLVRIGLIKANVLSATTQQLTVTVPKEATYGRISVTVDGLTGYSNDYFTLAFPYDQTGFKEKSFTSEVELPGKAGFGNVADLDGDGKVDVITFVGNNGTLTLAKNTSENGVLSFAPTLSVNTASELLKSISIGDLDGDGKQDIVGRDYTTISFYRNTSQLGSVSLAPIVKILASPYEEETGPVRIFDIDHDGRNDLIVSSIAEKRISILLNKTVAGQVSFGDRTDISVSGGVNDLAVGDLNGDGLLDIVALTPGTSTMSVFLNKTAGGNLGFGAEINIAAEVNASDIKLGDFDNDGKLDVIYCNSFHGNIVQTFGILKNISTLSTVAFDKEISIVAPSLINGFCIADFDGDGKKDFFAQGLTDFYAYKNLTTGNKIQFADHVDYPLVRNQGNWNVYDADIDGDGLPDVLRFSNGSPSVLLRSYVGIKPTIASVSPGTGYAGSNIEIKGSALQNASAITFGGVPVKSFYIVNSTWIQVVLGEGASGDVLVNTPLGVAKYSGFSFRTTPVISSFSPTFGRKGTEVTVRGKDLANIKQVSFGGKPATAVTVVSATELKATVGEGSTGQVDIFTGTEGASLNGFTYLAEPVIYSTVPPVLKAGSSIPLSVTYNFLTGGNFNYVWTRDGQIISGASGMNYTATQTGSYEVYFIHEGNKLVSNAIRVTNGFTLPSNNFKIKNTAVSCKGSANGSIGIDALQNLNYVATITQIGGITQLLSFTRNTSLNNLSPGKYSVCITVQGEADYQQCFEVLITEPQDISLYSVINPNQTVTLLLSGASSYHIKINEKSYTTNNSEITLPVQTGNNSISVSSDLGCQGSVSKLIDIPVALKISPNPFEQELTLQTNAGINENLKIEVFDLNGNRVYSGIHNNETGTLKLNLGKLTQGMYVLKLVTSTQVFQSKIIKK